MATSTNANSGRDDTIAVTMTGSAADEATKALSHALVQLEQAAALTISDTRRERYRKDMEWVAWLQNRILGAREQAAA